MNETLIVISYHIWNIKTIFEFTIRNIYLNFGFSLDTTATSISVGLKSADNTVIRQVIARWMVSS